MGNQGILQGHSLSLLLFCLALNTYVRIKYDMGVKRGLIQLVEVTSSYMLTILEIHFV